MSSVRDRLAHALLFAWREDRAAWGAAPTDPAVRRTGRRARGLWAAVTCLTLLGTPMHVLAVDPFVDAVASFTPGAHAGFGSARFPEVVLGPPRGGGEVQGSLDVLSLGDGGSIVLRFDQPVICDGPGPDFTIFENAFHAGSPSGPLFAEVGVVAVSQDGVNFIEYPYDPVSFAGLAGVAPVFSSPDNGIAPTDPSVSGGDRFDLASVGLAWAAFVRISDPGAAIPDSGSRIPPGESGGFDLDAVAAVHACGQSQPTATPPTPVALTPTPTTTATATATATPEVALPVLLSALFSDEWNVTADVSGDGRITAADLVLVGGR